MRAALAGLVLGTLALGGFPAASAGCAFTVRADALTFLPRTDANITVECLHDAANNPLAGKTVTVEVTRPNGASSTHAVTTDESGGANFVYTNTHGIGTYTLSATSGLAIATSSFAVASGVAALPTGGPTAAGGFQLLPSAGCIAAGPAPSITLNAFGIRDAAGDPAAPNPVTFTIKAPSVGTVEDIVTPPVTFTRTATSTRPVPASDSDFTTASVAFDFMTDGPASTLHSPAGTWSVTAATQSVSATTTFQVLAAIPSGTPATLDLTAPTGRIIPGLPATLTATVKTAAGTGLPCESVSFTVTPPGGGTPVVTTVQTNASGVATLPYNRTDVYGAYSVLAEIGSLSKTATFTANPGAITFSSSIASYVARTNPARQAAGNSVTVMAANVVDNTRRPLGVAEDINIWVTKPDGTTRYEDAITVATASHRTGRADAIRVLTASEVDQTGDWLVQEFTGESATGDPALDWTVDAAGLFLGTFASTQFQVVAALPAETPGDPARDLGVEATDANTLGGSVDVTVSGIPAGSDLVEITVTRPDSTTYTKSTAAIAGGQATISLSGASETGAEGLYEVAAASSASGTPNGTGAASFIVSVPRTLTVTATPSVLGMPGDAATLTAELTETLTSAAVPGVGMTIELENFAGIIVVSESDVTDSNGKYSVTVSLVETLLPGTYTVTATSALGHVATGTLVVVAPIPPAPPQP